VKKRLTKMDNVEGFEEVEDEEFDEAIDDLELDELP